MSVSASALAPSRSASSPVIEASIPPVITVNRVAVARVSFILSVSLVNTHCGFLTMPLNAGRTKNIRGRLSVREHTTIWSRNIMKTTIIDENGAVRCPRCGAVDSFTAKRTGRAKLLGAAAGGVGVLVMPKRLRCNGCGQILKPDTAAAVRQETSDLLDRRRELRAQGLGLWATQRQMHRESKTR